MGMFGRMNAGLESVSDRVVVHSLRRNTGPVGDSLVGELTYAVREQPPGLVVTGAGLPPVAVEVVPRRATCRIGTTELTLDPGARGVRRKTWIGSARLDGRDYRLVPRCWHRAHLLRDGARLAVLTRPRGRSRSARWQAAARIAEMARCHALAAYCGIGSPGAVVNLIGELG